MQLVAGPPLFATSREVERDSLELIGDKVWREILRIGETLGGVHLASIRYGRPRTSSLRLHSPHPHVRLYRSLGSIDRVDQRWAQLEIMLHLRGWQYDRTLTNEYVDLYVNPYVRGEGDLVKDRSDTAVSLIKASKRELEQACTAIVRIALDEQSCRVVLDDPVWREECVPDSGSGAFNLAGLLVEAHDRP